MPLYQAVVLAIIQGLSEFLPISSTAHLVLFPWLFHWKDPGLTFDVALHAGTLVAVLLYFWKMWFELVTSAMGLGNSGDTKVAENRRLFWFLVIGTIPGGIAGYLLEHAAEDQFRTPVVIGLALIIVGVLMWLGERTTPSKSHLQNVSFIDAILVGVAQAFAVIPGVSRSGVTMTAGLFRSLNRETTARFSFLLSTPLIAGAVVKKGLEIRHEGIPPDMRLPFVVGIIVSGLVGYLVIGILIRYLEIRTFKIFVVYRLALGVLVLALGWGLRH
jgi:undecaprenyl-diphosphatase